MLTFFWKYVVDYGFLIGWIVNACIFIPQAIRLYRAKTTREVSFLTFFGFNIIQAFTLLHGYKVHDTFLMLGDGCSIITCGTVTILAFIYRHNKGINGKTMQNIHAVG